MTFLGENSSNFLHVFTVVFFFQVPGSSKERHRWVLGSWQSTWFGCRFWHIMNSNTNETSVVSLANYIYSITLDTWSRSPWKIQGKFVNVRAGSLILKDEMSEDDETLPEFTITAPASQLGSFHQLDLFDNESNLWTCNLYFINDAKHD